MSYMDIILRDDIKKLGSSGDLVRVKSGYGRNYLIPKGFAIKATKKNKAKMEHEKRVIGIRRAKMVKTAEDLKAKLEELKVTISKKVGENEKLFGSVTQKDIALAIASEGYKIDKKKIHLAEAIKTVGVHDGTVDLGNGVEASIKIWVVSE